MEQAIIKHYRRLLQVDFEHSGSIEDASIFVEAVGQKAVHCGNTGNYMQLYASVVDGRIDDIKYLCSCEPTANVAVEALCTLAKGISLEEASAITEQDLYQYLGCEGEELKLKVRGLLEMLKEGISGYKAKTPAPKVDVALG